MELVSSRDEFPLFEKTISWKDDFGFKKIYPFTLSLHPLSSLLSPLSYVAKTTIYL